MVNLLLEIVAVYWLDLGIAGSAWSTVIVQVLAAGFDDQVPDDVKHERLERLVELVQSHAARRNAALVGTVQEVLSEGPSRTDPLVCRGKTRGGKTTLFTPAVPAGTAASVLIEETTSQPDVRRQAIAATSEVDRLTRRIEQVLALARSDANAGLIEATDASAAAQDRVGHAQIIAEERRLDLDAHIEAGVAVMCSVGTFARVLDELLSNAFAYARSRVRVSLTRGSESVTLTVEDDGPGIADEERDLVFDRFARGSGSVPGGSGLGLALVREAARGAGGDATATRSDLGGLRVEVTWPLSQ